MFHKNRALDFNYRYFVNLNSRGKAIVVSFNQLYPSLFEGEDKCEIASIKYLTNECRGYQFHKSEINI